MSPDDILELADELSAGNREVDWRAAANCGHPDVTAAGRRLNDLRGQRNWADYDLDRPFPHTTAFDQVQAAMNILQTLQAAVNSAPLLSAITDTIKSYERDVLRQATWQP